MKNSYLVYLNHEGIQRSIFSSQVLAPLEGLAKSTPFSVTLIGFESPPFFLKRSERREHLKQFKGKIVNRVFFPRLPYLFQPLYIPILGIVVFYLFLRHGNFHEGALFHARGPVMAFVSLLLRRCLPARWMRAVIYDCRGDGIAETEIYHDQMWFKPLRLFALKKMESFVLKRADCIFAVTETLKETLKSRYRFDKPCLVMPSVVSRSNMGMPVYKEDIRREQRRRLGIEDRVVILYSGSMLAWEVPHLIIKLFLEFKRQDTRAFLMVLSKEKEKFRKLLHDSGLSQDSFMVETVDYRTIATYLCCGDAGLLLREQNDVNAAASPTKFAEYLCCGVPVIATPGIGQTERIINNEGCGWILTPAGLSETHEADVRKIREDLERNRFDREAIASMADRIFSLDKRVLELSSLYRGLLEKPNVSK